MKCERKQKCTLHLKVQTLLLLSESIHGVSFCTVSAGMMTDCQSVVFTKASRKKLSRFPVTVENDCTEVSPNQQLQVTVKTIPDYCNISWTTTYLTPECNSEDLRMNVPECITGRLSYVENPEKKELEIHVSDMLEGHDYHLRLCHKDFICLGTGAKTLMHKEKSNKSAILQYSRPLPCLCIEGWADLEELWFKITFDSAEEALTWKPACPISAVAGLCEKREDGNCMDLPDSLQNVSRERLTFAKVDPHPDLCMKFSVGSQSWIRCPFAGTIKAWEVVMTREQGQEDLQLQSMITATFSLGLCTKSGGSSKCQTTKTKTVHVEKQKAVNLELTGLQCSSCVQVKRLDVKFSPTAVYCFEQCLSKSSHPEALNLTWVILVTAACLSGIVIVALVLHILQTVHHRRKQSTRDACGLTKQTDPSSDSVVSTFQPKAGRVLVPDSPLCGKNEKANLIS
uniref:Interleukin 17 receptor E n=1 Tax=Nothobranchius kadleci TaxID=1051664 RepID=A0A1A8C373_NOTKA